jgi:WhiB family redox-sensing transcriptional regulator
MERVDFRSWRSKAKCYDVDPNLFVPSIYARGEKRPEAYKPPVQIDKAFCIGCLVEKICLEYAIANKEHGVWGGTDEDERLDMINQRELIGEVATVDDKSA